MYLPTYRPTDLSAYLSIYLSIYLSVVCLSIHLSVRACAKICHSLYFCVYSFVCSFNLIYVFDLFMCPFVYSQIYLLIHIHLEIYLLTYTSLLIYYLFIYVCPWSQLIILIYSIYMYLEYLFIYSAIHGYVCSMYYTIIYGSGIFPCQQGNPVGPQSTILPLCEDVWLGSWCLDW